MNQVEERSISYLCPDCKQSVIVTKDLFSLAATTAEVVCPCKKSMLTVDFMADMVTMHIPCHVCKEQHKVTCPSTAFVGEDLLTFSCSGISCCLTGDEGAVFKGTARMEQEADLWDEQREEKDCFLNPLVMEEVLEELKEIASRGGISCVCGGEKWAVSEHFTLVEIGCASCGRATRIPATTPDDIENICCTHEIKIGSGLKHGMGEMG